MFFSIENEHQKKHDYTENNECYSNIINAVFIIPIVLLVKVFQYRDGTKEKRQNLYCEEHHSDLFSFSAIQGWKSVPQMYPLLSLCKC